ncbi:MAG: ketopantoate reductase C-terminal domain-containing protein [Thermomicrobiales bacterium]
MATFHAAALSAELSPNIRVVLWEKFLSNVAGGSLSGLTRLPYRALCSYPETFALCRGMMEEAVAVALGMAMTPSRASSPSSPKPPHRPQLPQSRPRRPGRRLEPKPSTAQLSASAAHTTSPPPSTSPSTPPSSPPTAPRRRTHDRPYHPAHLTSQAGSSGAFTPGDFISGRTFWNSI